MNKKAFLFDGLVGWAVVMTTIVVLGWVVNREGVSSCNDLLEQSVVREEALQRMAQVAYADSLGETLRKELARNEQMRHVRRADPFSVGWFVKDREVNEWGTEKLRIVIYDTLTNTVSGGYVKVVTGSSEEQMLLDLWARAREIRLEMIEARRWFR